jgi:hypothetical protein
MSNEQLSHHLEFEKELYAPIPWEILDVKGYDSIEIKENGEPLVPGRFREMILTDFLQARFITGNVTIPHMDEVL